MSPNTSKIVPSGKRKKCRYKVRSSLGVTWYIAKCVVISLNLGASGSVKTYSTTAHLRLSPLGPRHLADLLQIQRSSPADISKSSGTKKEPSYSDNRRYKSHTRPLICNVNK